MNIQDVRQKFPQYSDMSDGQLADALHQKFYSDIPKEAFYSQIGLKPEQPAVTAGDRAGAAIGGVNRGLAGLAGLPVDTVENIINLGIAAYGASKQALTGKPGPDLLQGSVGGSQYIADKMQGAGINTQNPAPQDRPSQMLYRGGTVLGGSMVPGASVPGALASATGAAVAEQIGGPQWAGVGAMVPGAVAQGAVAAKNAIADRVAPQMAAYRELGVEPSVGQATKANFIQGFENLLSKFPGGQGIFRKFVENQQAKISENTATGVSGEKAGRTIEKGISGDGGFLDRTKQKWVELDNAVAEKIPQGFKAQPSNTVQALNDLTAPVAGAEKTTAALVNPKLAQIKDNLIADINSNGGSVPFDALRSLRSKVGSMLDESLVSGIPNGELKRVYGALSKDLEYAANQAGAGNEFARQSNYYKARMDRIDGVLSKVLGKNRTDSQIFDVLNPKNPDESSIVTATLRSLKPEERQVVSDAVVQRLGRAAPGRQDAEGNTFSTETFLTNWNKISPQAKAQLFPDTKQRNNLDALANVADDLRAGAKVFANPSGTAGAAAPYGIGYAAAAGAAGTVGGLIAGSYIGAKMLTSPAVVEWLAKTSKASTPAQQQAQLGRLGVIFNETKDEQLRQELSNYVSSIGKSGSQQ